MVLIVGLGNPGKEYERTRHNAGFLAVEQLQKELGFPGFKTSEKWKAEASEGEESGEKILLVKPGTYMNLSGEAVQKIAHFYKVPLEKVWLIYDDVDLPLGEIRIRKEGSAGTHNGMRSVVESLGTENFPRFRLGVGDGAGLGFGKSDLKDWILSKISPQDWETFQKMIHRAAEALELALKDGIEAAMNRWNG